MEYQIKYENGIANHGNLYRLKKVMDRAKAGEALNIAFLGGSITQGSLSSKPELCYAYHVYEWWKKTFPQADFTYINAGIGGTTSQFGVARAEDDLLSKEPDFVIIEFSVNDESTGSILGKHMRDWCARYIPVKQNRQFFWCIMYFTIMVEMPN